MPGTSTTGDNTATDRHNFGEEKIMTLNRDASARNRVKGRLTDYLRSLSLTLDKNPKPPPSKEPIDQDPLKVSSSIN
jgi:hypothetical protein